MVKQRQDPPTKKRRRGCRGCLLSFVIVIAALIGLWFLAPVALRVTGVLPPEAEELYSGAPDPAASEAVEMTLIDAGIGGARAVVLPVKGSDAQVAVITLDESVTMEGSGKASAEEAFMETIRGLSGPTASGVNVERAVVDIRGENGKPFLAFTASQESIDAYANGDIDRREFLRTVDADLSNLLDLLDVQTLMEGELE